MAQHAKDPKEFLKLIKRMTLTDHRENQQTIRNENGIVLEGEGIIKGFTKKFKNTFRIPTVRPQQRNQSSTTHTRNPPKNHHQQ